MRYTPLLILFLLFSSCEHKAKVVSKENIRFDTNDATVLFFKNVRRAYYDVEEKPDVNISIYRFEEWEELKEKPLLRTAIIHHWVANRAFVFLETDLLLEDKATFEVHYTNCATGETGTIPYKKGNTILQAGFATDLYEKVQQSCQLYVELEGKKHPLFGNQEGNEAFRITMVDYYRLVQML
ncbi:hypothetical protein [Persicobacter sp. CCB-QB2]|uniref:hypothetical protein n=1 Tax=Persicobacter sp. CCB-QB2 TaxID=1561025 RepID=UPI0006A9DB9A|nr:hypothetical protein [Persicobacter sp. CCB-QB2]